MKLQEYIEYADKLDLAWIDNVEVELLREAIQDCAMWQRRALEAEQLHRTHICPPDCEWSE
jgi:hypothetical protein